MEHSKLPWKVEKYHNCGDNLDKHTRICDADGVTVANTYPYFFGIENYPFIVEACNNYERLLAENKAYETNNKNQAKELDDLYEKIGYLEGLVSKYQEAEILRLAGGEKNA